MPFSTASGVGLYYEVAGEGPPVCLINGYRLNGMAWPDAFIESLAERLTVIRFDNRGTGRSNKPPSGYGFASQARDVVMLLDSLGLQRAHIFGYSMGGAIAQEVAILYPKRIDRLVLFGTFCAGIWSDPPSLSVFRRLLPAKGQTPEEAARQAWPVTYSPEYLASNADAAEQQMRRELQFPTPLFVAEQQMQAIRRSNRYWDLPSITAPTLVATGTHDVLVKPRNSSILASRIPNARLEFLSDLGHRAIWEAPEEIAELVGDFLVKRASRRVEAVVAAVGN